MGEKQALPGFHLSFKPKCSEIDREALRVPALLGGEVHRLPRLAATPPAMLAVAVEHHGLLAQPNRRSLEPALERAQQHTKHIAGFCTQSKSG